MSSRRAAPAVQMRIFRPSVRTSSKWVCGRTGEHARLDDKMYKADDGGVGLRNPRVALQKLGVR